MPPQTSKTHLPATGLLTRDWIGGPEIATTARAKPSSAWIGLLVGAAVGGLIAIAWSPVVGGIVIVVAICLTAIRVAAPAIGRAIDRGLEWFGQFVGRLVAWVTLVPLYIVGFTIARGIMRLTGRDPLQLRSTDTPTFWNIADSDSRKTRCIRTMFATERLDARRGSLFLRVLMLCVVGAAVAEASLRVAGFGRPVLYLNDPQVGFMPAPDQSVVRYGGRIDINDYGMRAPNYAYEKPANTVRVLMLGDSTLYGGSYVDQDDLYARRLESQLQETVGRGRSVQVLNMGVNAWGPFHKYGYVDRYGSFGADIAIICLPIWDIFRPASRLTESGPFHLAGNPPGLALFEIQHAARAQLLPYLRKVGFAPPAKMDRGNPEQGSLGIEEYGLLGERLRREGCEVFVEVLPSCTAAAANQTAPWESEAIANLRERVVMGGARFAYPLEFFARSPGVEPNALYHDDTHLSEGGHAFYAPYLRQRILETVQLLSISAPSELP